jgi:hypothetical protein
LGPDGETKYRRKPLGKAPGKNSTTATTAATKNSGVTEKPEDAEEEKPTVKKYSTNWRGQKRRLRASTFPLATTAVQEGGHHRRCHFHTP